VDQHRRDRGIDAAGQRADDAALADLGPDRRDRLLAIGGHGPVAFQPGDVVDEVGKQPGAVRRVRHFRVELDGVEIARLVGDCREGCARGRADDAEAFGKGGDPVAMAHPHLMAGASGPDAVEQRIFIADVEEGAAEFAVFAALDPAAELLAHHLLAVADAKYRNAGLEHDLRRAGAVGLGCGGRAAGQDHRLRLHAPEGVLGGLERDDLGIDAGLAHAARDQLRHLAAEIDDEDCVGVSGRGHGEAVEKLRRLRKMQAGSGGG
jgi:hypothetical protein